MMNNTAGMNKNETLTKYLGELCKKIDILVYNWSSTYNLRLL